MKILIALLATTSLAGAQGSVPLRGIAYDSLHGRPLVGAFIGIQGLSATAVSDSLGHFVLPAVPRGTHRVIMQHDVLDAIGIPGAGTQAVVTGDRDSVFIAVPSFPTLWRAACGTPAPASADSGFVFGSVLRANQPVPLATVAASWIDLYVDSTKAVRQKQKLMEVEADSSGNFALCGVPTSTGLSIRATIGSYGSVWVDVLPLDKERIARRDLAILGQDAGGYRRAVDTSAERPRASLTCSSVGWTSRPPRCRTSIDSARHPHPARKGEVIVLRLSVRSRSR